MKQTELLVVGLIADLLDQEIEDDSVRRWQ